MTPWIGEPAPDRRRVEARFRRQQRGVGRGRKLAVSYLGDQRLAMLEIREHQRDAGSPLVRIHVRRALSSGDLAEPACVLDSDGADADPHRPRVVANE